MNAPSRQIVESFATKLGYQIKVLPPLPGENGYVRAQRGLVEIKAVIPRHLEREQGEQEAFDALAEAITECGGWGL